MTSPRCDRRYNGRKDACGTPMHSYADAIGRVIWTCERCDWQRAGRCWRCGRPRQNLHLLASFCTTCRKASQQASNRRSQDDPAIAKERRDRDRIRSRTPERQAQRRAWRAANPEKIKRYKRREALNPTPAKKAREARHNADPVKRERKRQYALAKYYERHPVRPQPICRVCGTAFPYIPPGRVPTRCDACVPLWERKARNATRAKYGRPLLEIPA